MANVLIDTGELREVAHDLSAVDVRLVPNVERVFSKAAVNIKKQLIREATGSRHFRGFAPGISYDRKGFAGFGGGEIVYEIGPEKGAPGSLANIAYFGTSRGGGTVPDPVGALNTEIENLIPHVEAALAKWVL